jgi:hypothetical protein
LRDAAHCWLGITTHRVLKMAILEEACSLCSRRRSAICRTSHRVGC